MTRKAPTSKRARQETEAEAEAVVGNRTRMGQPPIDPALAVEPKLLSDVTQGPIMIRNSHQSHESGPS